MTMKINTRTKATPTVSSAHPKSKPHFAHRLTHEEEMVVLRRQAILINKSPQSATDFLKRAGLMTPSGRWRQLIRD